MFFHPRNTMPSLSNYREQNGSRSTLIDQIPELEAAQGNTLAQLADLARGFFWVSLIRTAYRHKSSDRDSTLCDLDCFPMSHALQELGQMGFGIERSNGCHRNLPPILTRSEEHTSELQSLRH